MQVPPELDPQELSELLLTESVKLIEGGYVNGNLWPSSLGLRAHGFVFVRHIRINNVVYAVVKLHKK